jgi:predicted TIM-barrel fold metal-dependent hydrolase
MGRRMIVNDSHCHFFSSRFFETLARQAGEPAEGAPDRLTARLGWDAPGPADALAARWRDELDRGGVRRAVLIASVPGDEASVAAAVRRYPDRFVGFFMLDPTSADADARVNAALGEMGLSGVCLFPAMHRYSLRDPVVARIAESVGRHPRAALFVHCGVLSVGVRARLGLPSRFDTGLGNPLDLQPLALGVPSLPIIVPHFGAGFLREALMLADVAPNVHLDTSSSNGWMKYHASLTLAEVFRQALSVAGPDRLLFGTDSSFFPRGWQRPIYEAQLAALDEIGVSDGTRARILGANFDRLFDLRPA